MSNAALTWCVKIHPGPGPKAVLLCLSDRATDHSGEDWTCFPSVKDICEFTDLGARTVERHLKHLWKEGIISRKRRRRADGRLGIYDYTLHREPERRAALKAARASVEDVEAAMEDDGPPPDNLAGGPAANLTGGPPANFAGTTRQIVQEPPANLAGQEPSVEPSGEPTNGRAREPGDAGFDEAAAAWPESGRKRTLWAKARAAWAWACDQETAERLALAIRACAADPEMARGDYGWPGLHTWLSEERWRAWLPKPAAAQAETPRTPFAGPPEILAAIAKAAGGQIDAAAYLDGASWREADRTVLTRTGLAAERLAQATAHDRTLNLRFERAPQPVDC